MAVLLSLAAGCSGEWYPDEDGDGFGTGPAGTGPRPAAAASESGDCDDTQASVFPGAEEICDGVDSDCDGVVPDDEKDGDLDGMPVCAGDCRDDAASVNPGAAEVCDGTDSDCDGALPADETDDDGDLVVECTVEGDWLGPAGGGGGDCDDADPDRAAGLPELCNGVDDDCDGSPAADEQDADGDGYVGCELGSEPWEGPPITGGGDCADDQPEQHPGMPEIEDGVDDDCDGSMLENESDSDGDGYIEGVVGANWLGDPAMQSNDCDDGDPEVYPTADEICDGQDNDCDLVFGDDERDQDGDGVVPCAFDAALWSGPASVTAGGDCNDRDPAVAPGATEVCDWQDNDCNGLADDADPAVDPASLRTFYVDDDADNYGVDTSTVTGCRLPAGYAPAPGDCDDTERAVHPFARESCDGIDNDCDTDIDDADRGLDPDLALVWFEDNDRDGFGTLRVPPLIQCDPPSLTSSTEIGDCNDANPDMHIGAPEPCNGVDDDCDGHPDLPASGGATSELGCDMCTTDLDYAQNNIAVEEVDPCALDPEAQDLCGQRTHDIYTRRDATVLRPELFLFFPPSEGFFNKNLMRYTAHAGFRTINLGQSNQVHIESVCPGQPDPGACAYDFLWESLYGEDTSPFLDIGPADSITGRMEALLPYLDAQHPGAGWDRYYDPSDGSVRWENIIVAGWSKGVHYGLIVANQYEVSGMFLISNPQGSPVTVELQGAECRRFGFYHTDETYKYDTIEEFEIGFRSIGIDGETQSIDDKSPWGANAQLFTTSTYEFNRDDCAAHKATCFDGCMDESENQAPTIELMCRIGEPDPATCL